MNAKLFSSFHTTFSKVFTENRNIILDRTYTVEYNNWGASSCNIKWALIIICSWLTHEIVIRNVVSYVGNLALMMWCNNETARITCTACIIFMGHQRWDDWFFNEEYYQGTTTLIAEVVSFWLCIATTISLFFHIQMTKLNHG